MNANEKPSGSADVSVVIPAYNCAPYVAEALDSVLAQTLPAKEIIVVDDGSTDKTWDALQPYAGRVRLLRQRNGGAAAARNLAIREARCEYVAFLDADDAWHPRKLEIQIEAAQRRPDVGLFSCDGSWLSEDWRAKASNHLEEPSRLEDLLLDHLILWRPISTPSVLVRRSILEELGGFDLQTPPAEDWDLWLRIARRAPIILVKQTLFYVRKHPGNISKNAWRMRNSALLVVKKQWPELDPARYPPSLRRKAQCRIYIESAIENLENGLRARAAWDLTASAFVWLFKVRGLSYGSRWVLMARALLGQAIFSRLSAMWKRI